MIRRTLHRPLVALVAMLAAAALVVSGAAGPAAADAMSTPPSAAARTSIDGVWRTDGYGTVLAIADGHARAFETTTTSCVEGDPAEQSGSVGQDGTVRFVLGAQGFTVRPSPARGRAVLHVDGSAGDRTLLRLRELPAACSQPAPTGPLATFDLFWTTYAENYPFFAVHDVDWQAVRDEYRPRVRPDLSDDELFDVLVEMITPLHDAHTGIRAGEHRAYIGHRPGTEFPSPEQNERVQAFVERRDLGKPLHLFGNDRIGYADLPGRLGYLRVIAFSAYTERGDFASDSAELDRILDEILTDARLSGPQALRGLVVDLRINGGGHDRLALQLASRLSGRPHFAYTTRARIDPDDPSRFTRAQPIWVRPDSPAYTGPVVLLTGGSTISAGETFTQAMFERRPRPVRIGENTQGVFSDTMIRTLPNGWQFILPNEEFRTRSGRSFDGVGIAPHLRTPVFSEEEFAHDRDSAFDRAVALLSR